MYRPLKIAFDVGGAISKYPDIFKTLIVALQCSYSVHVYIISDMHPVEKIVLMLNMNGIVIPSQRVFSADYKTHGENCKAVLCKEIGIDVLIDDFIGYVAEPGSPLVRLLLMPDGSRDYYSSEWQTDGSEGSFGRRVPPGSKRPPEDRA